ncbi:putative glutathione transferase [Helianthus annuus]|uniref:Glutathione transferase n=1 Tax=Helianthus annuus TaxID=4232 RepID=A0A9K3I6X5_HELAN|nr:putative glutathione transferase [Helianthus annuus]KAJ0526439.1 putative glutathione transferase [Helianthus annuus]KAJ0542833.1 putative glutathione transferase [Helianthus annuus]KAJ0707887.1 putative glutathione transferase [Helianthus annuus]KAJ0711865.1 putative glutathione transferase [Helianthus annuus]
MMRGAWNFPPVQPQPIPTPPVQPQPIPTPPVQSEPEDDVEIVPETQPPKGKGKRNKGKQVVGDQTSKPKAIKWTPIEEEALAKAFIGTSDNPVKGNNQPGDGFWSKVLTKFLAMMDQGPYRDIDSVSSKWRKLNSTVNRFCEEYNKLYTSDRRSGWNDEDVFKMALEKYKQNNHGSNFPHVRAWMVLKNDPKWAPIPNEVAMAKRQKTSETGSLSASGSDARCHINLNDDADYDEDEYNVREPERPPGRDKTKKERAKGKGKEKVDLNMVEFMEHLKVYNDISAQKTKAKERAVEEKSRASDEKLKEKVRLSNEKIRISDEKIRLKEWEIMTMNVEDEPEPKRSMLKKLQHDIMKKHQII